MVNFGSVECGETYKRRPVWGGVATVEGRFFCWGGGNLLVYLCFLCVRFVFVFVLMVRTKTTLRRGRRKMGRSRSTMRVRSRSLRRGTFRSRRQGGMLGDTSLQGRDVDTLKKGYTLVAEGKFHKKCTSYNKSQWKVRLFELYISDDKSKKCRILYFGNGMFGDTVLKGTRVLSQMIMMTKKCSSPSGNIPEIALDEIHFTPNIRQSGQSMPKETTEPLIFKFYHDDYIKTGDIKKGDGNDDEVTALEKFESILKYPKLAKRLTPTPR